MWFLTPLFFVGLASLAIPIVIHLIQRERRRVIEFPSLMFLRRIPYQSVRRRRIRNRALLLVRLTALAVIVAAFARPFLRRADVAAARSSAAREIVVLLDTSYSMDYGDRWTRARQAATNSVNGLGPTDRASIVLFSSDPEVALRSTGDRGRLLAAITVAETTAGTTRYGPALKLAGSILADSPLPRREAILISDFQRRGWAGTEAVRLPDGATLTAVPVSGRDETANLAVTPISLQRSRFSGQERVTVAGGVINRSGRAMADLEMTLEIGGRTIQTQRVDVEAHGSRAVTFAPFTIASANTRGTVRIAADPLTRDNAFHFVVSPAVPIRVLVIDRGGPASLYLSRALSIGDAPRFDLALTRPDAFTTDPQPNVDVMVLNDVPVAAASADRLARFVGGGGGLLVVAGERAAWPAGGPDILPGLPAAFVDRSRDDAGRMSALEYWHPVFELFRGPRSGDFSTVRVYGYRAVSAAPSAQVLARFEDGGTALAERKTGNGRVLIWTSSLDLLWNDLALKPVFLPFVHRMVRHLAAYTEPTPWLTIGQVLEPSPTTARAPTTGRVALTPSGHRIALDDEGPDVLELAEQGFYEIRAQGRGSAPPVTVASNVDLSESDLTSMDPREVVAMVAGHSSSARMAGRAIELTPEAEERAQHVWWYLLVVGLMLLGVETVLSNRLSGMP
ncbi:MAG: BatA domain-containing protein [Acidobacteria bacterium]|nr:BatA domain-containing protein [Acidobacteriota bacterium]